MTVGSDASDGRIRHPPGWAAMFQVLLLAGISGGEYVVRDVEEIVAVFGPAWGTPWSSHPSRSG